MAARDIFIKQGSDLRLRFTFVDSGGDEIDLTGFTAAMQVRRCRLSDEPCDELTTGNGRLVIDGASIVATWPAALTERLQFVKAVYDLEVTQDGHTSRLLAGNVFVQREVTR